MTLVMVATLCSACTTLYVDAPDALNGSRTYVGIVKVRAAEESSQASAASRVRRHSYSTLGLRVDSGLSLGYLNDEVVSIPLNCHVVLFVRAPEEWGHAETLLRQLRREDSCLIRSN
ncbi:hypothetical protein KAK06_21520 [Ideonella sp. 4Y11]|uniref:Uncharacterized protein n=1 Tax=Ideonella aquatica TaxID=2824119 RepID=A0A940YJR6_9BURK|nr:hypothetical protein [Ideonella aquatica]MBQ0961533.1 hypothetical protein [Ideonella aquatica]